MKKHLIPILIIILLGLTGLLLYAAASMYDLGTLSSGQSAFAETALAIATLVPCLYGPAAALLIPLHRKDRAVPRGYAWLGVAAFMAAVIGLAVINAGFYAVYMPEMEAWLLLSWAAWGLLLPFFVSSVAHLKATKPQRTWGRVMTAVLVCLGIVLLAGGGLYLHAMSKPHLVSDLQERKMYQQLQEMIDRDYSWDTVDGVTDSTASVGEAGERTLAGEERTATVRLCRELLRPIAQRWDISHTASVLPGQRAMRLLVFPDMDVTVDGEACHLSQCSLMDYTWTGAGELELVFTQGETLHTVTLYWAAEPEE